MDDFWFSNLLAKILTIDNLGYLDNTKLLFFTLFFLSPSITLIRDIIRSIPNIRKKGNKKGKGIQTVDQLNLPNTANGTTANNCIKRQEKIKTIFAFTNNKIVKSGKSGKMKYGIIDKK